MNVRRTTPTFSRQFIKLYRSWTWVRSDFADEFDRLSEAGEFLPDRPSSRMIWKTRNKFVLRVSTALGFDLAYKSFYRIHNFHHHFFSPSPSAEEALNYLLLAKLGFPLPELLATGEIRTGFLIRNSFMITRFMEDFRDGGDFGIGGPLEHDEKTMMEFCRGHLSMLAKLHDEGILHRGFTPANLMYRQDADGMKFCWIDVASCCRAFITTKRIADDIINLFRFLDLSGAARRELEEWYLNAAVKRRTDAETLWKVLEERLAARLKRKNRVPRP